MATGTVLLPLFAVSLITAGFVLSANANERKTTIITFDVPGAGTGAGQGTEGLAISNNGTITGVYADSGYVLHGYVLPRNGAFMTFDAPGYLTIPWSINPAGTITGFYSDANFVWHGFVRADDGTFTTFDAPGAGTGSGQGTVPNCINPAGAIVGQYVDASNVLHGFLLGGE
jgi:hypothetical protein